MTELLLLALTAADFPSAPPPPPPPPPPVVAVKPKNTEPLRVGGNVQAANFELGSRLRSIPRDAESVLKAERAIHANPNDTCARETLIVSSTSPRTEHLVWMIRHHPDWDGFASRPQVARWSEPRSLEEEKDVGQLIEAWLGQIAGPASAPILYDAAMFFALREPERAVTLLGRGMSEFPAAYWTTGLGLLYATHLQQPLSPGTRPGAFALKAASVLNTSVDSDLLRGAAQAYNRGLGYAPGIPEHVAKSVTWPQMRPPWQPEDAMFHRPTCGL